LSALLSTLDFEIHLFDDRFGLNTFEQNHFAGTKHIADYAQIANAIPSDTDSYFVVMTLGYRSDITVLKDLVSKKFRYYGVLGSAAKVAQIQAELSASGFSDTLLNQIKIPIGLSIGSQTPAEIAVSIATEMIAESREPA
jgi:xanthine dehydrogenase accessory factor